MIGDLKIPIVKDPKTGEDCVLPEAFDVLMRFGEHRQLCSQCEMCFTRKGGPTGMCPTGMALHEELLAIPGVEYINVRPG